MMIIRVALVMVCLLLEACTSYAVYNHDPNEKVHQGIIIEKSGKRIREVMKTYNSVLIGSGYDFNEQRAKTSLGEVDDAANYITPNSAYGAGDLIVINLLSNLTIREVEERAKEEVIEYTVRGNDKKFYKVFSQHTGFSIGDCVSLFLSEQPEKYPPRMGYGSSCE